jgi:hypothetical protein
MPPVRATVTIDGASVTILPRRAPVGNSGPIRGRTVTVVPVAEGGAVPPGDRPTYDARLEPRSQPAVAILDLTEAEARQSGAERGVTEVLFWDGRRARILACE